MMEVKNKDLAPVIGNMQIMGHEQVVFCNDSETGLKAIIAIHDTTLGPALEEQECGITQMKRCFK